MIVSSFFEYIFNINIRRKINKISIGRKNTKQSIVNSFQENTTL